MNGETFETLGDAIQSAAATGSTIKLASNAVNAGVAVAEGSEFVLDLNGYELLMTGPGAGSQGTKTLGLQLLKGSTVIIKNGRIDFEQEDPSQPLKMGIQNYSNLTLDNVKLTGGPTIQYVVSNNCGDVVFKNKTSITPTGDNVAFDVWYGMNVIYDEGVNVTIADNTVQINGKVEFGKHNRASLEDFAEHASLTCPSDMDLNISVLTPPCAWTDNGDGSKTFRYQLAD